MSKGPKLFLTAVVLGTCASLVAIGLTVVVNWFFRGEAGISGEMIGRHVVLGFVIGVMPVGLMWARSRKERDEPPPDSR